VDEERIAAEVEEGKKTGAFDWKHWASQMKSCTSNIIQLDLHRFQIPETDEELRLVGLPLLQIPAQSSLVITDLSTALQMVEGGSDAARDALTYLVDHQTELTQPVKFAMPGSVAGNSDPRWNKIRSASVSICFCGKYRELVTKP
jgi:hypothetical protein